MAYIPTITTNTTPAVDITLAGVMNYEEFIASLGTYNYKVNEMYISADTMAQLTERVRYNIFNATGQQVDNIVIVSPDPYQKQKAIVLDTKCDNVYLNGQSSFAFKLKARENVVMQLATEMFTMVNGGKATLPSNSNLMNDTLGNMRLFNERYTRFSCDKQKITKVITVYITNNTDNELYIDILNGINSQQPGLVNSTTVYEWNITTEVYASRNFVSLQVQNADDSYTVHTSPPYPGGINNPDDVVAAMNTLNVGVFYKDEVSGQIYVKTNNNSIVYGELVIGPPAEVVWNVAAASQYGQQSIGSTIIVYASFIRLIGIPVDLINYTTAYVWIRKQPVPQDTVWGSQTIPFGTAPNWGAFLGNPSAAINAWLQPIIATITGDPNGNYQDIFDEAAFTYSMDLTPPGTWPGQTGRASLEAAGVYTFGLLNLAANTGYVILVKFSKFI